jgi:hypothetical protein
MNELSEIIQRIEEIDYEYLDEILSSQDIAFLRDAEPPKEES